VDDTDRRSDRRRWARSSRSWTSTARPSRNPRALQRAIGDLGEQSGLIARNYEEVQDLKRKGERDYLTSTSRSRSNSTASAPLPCVCAGLIRRVRFTVTLLADDREIEKKDKTLLEPVQFT